MWEIYPANNGWVIRVQRFAEGSMISEQDMWVAGNEVELGDTIEALASDYRKSQAEYEKSRTKSAAKK